MTAYRTCVTLAARKARNVKRTLMQLIDNNAEEVVVGFTREELYMLMQAMSEVCDGDSIPNSEFVTRMGWDRPAYSRLLDQIGDARRNSN